MLSDGRRVADGFARERERGVCGDGVATGVANRRKRRERLGDELGRRGDERRLSRNEGTRASTLRRNAIARVASDAFAAPSACCSAR